MKFRNFCILALSWLLVACSFNNEQPGIATTIASNLTEANNTPIALTDSSPPLQTVTTTSLSTITASPTSMVFPELGGSHVWIEKNFKPYGFEFTEPYGKLILQKSRGDLYDMDMQILTTSIGYSLTRSELLVVVEKPLSVKEISYVLELFRLFWATSTNSDGKEAADWINATLPTLALNTESKKDFGIIKTRINVMPVVMSDSQEKFGYSLTLWVDPVPTTVGEAVHISVEAITPLKDSDELTLSCWDYEDPETTTWSISAACVHGCVSDNPNVLLENSKITVFEGFPVTYDQWSVKVELDPLRQATYPPNTYQLRIVFHNRTYTCTNNHEISWNEGGEAGIFVEIRGGEQRLSTDDPVGMNCVEE